MTIRVQACEDPSILLCNVDRMAEMPIGSLYSALVRYFGQEVLSAISAKEKIASIQEFNYRIIDSLIYVGEFKGGDSASNYPAFIKDKNQWMICQY